MTPGFARRIIQKADASLRARLVVPTALLAAASAGLMVFTATGFHSADLRHEHRDRAVLFASLVTDAVMTNMSEDYHDNGDKLLHELKGHRPDLVALSILGENGTVSSSTDPALRNQRLWDPARVAAREPIDLPDTADFAVIRPLVNERRCAECHGRASRPLGWIALRFSADPVAHSQHTLTATLMLAAIPSLLFLIGVSWWLLGREAVRPIQRLVSAMERAEAGETNVKADEGRKDEFGVAARKFDATLASLRNTQAELEKAYEGRMERADRFAMVGQMATGLAHEIKNPLAGLSGALELLAEDLVASPQQSEVVAEMRHQVQRLTDIMGGLLSVARPPRAMLRDTDVNSALEKVFFLVSQQHSKTTVAFHRQFDPHLPKVTADPAQLEQVLLNIGLNAFQAVSPRGGTVTIRTQVRDHEVEIEFADDGPGIAPALRPSIFTPFFTTRSNGTGLGLALSMRLISEHGGKLWFECPSQGGTRFFIRLPIATSPQPLVEPHAAPGAQPTRSHP